MSDSVVNMLPSVGEESHGVSVNICVNPFKQRRSSIVNMPPTDVEETRINIYENPFIQRRSPVRRRRQLRCPRWATNFNCEELTRTQAFIGLLILIILVIWSSKNVRNTLLKSWNHITSLKNLF